MKRKPRRRFPMKGDYLADVAAAVPAAIVALALLWFGDHTPKVQWTLDVLIVGGLVSGSSSARANMSFVRSKR